MKIGEAIYSILQADTTIKEYVDNKIFPMMAPDARALEYITYTIISDVRNKNKDREVTVDAIRIQIDCFAKTYERVVQISDAVSDVLSYYSGTVEGIDIDIITFEDENDLSDIENKTYRKEQDFIIRVKPLGNGNKKRNPTT